MARRELSNKYDFRAVKENFEDDLTYAINESYHDRKTIESLSVDDIADEIQYAIDLVDPEYNGGLKPEQAKFLAEEVLSDMCRAFIIEDVKRKLPGVIEKAANEALKIGKLFIRGGNAMYKRNIHISHGHWDGYWMYIDTIDDAVRYLDTDNSDILKRYSGKLNGYSLPRSLLNEAKTAVLGHEFPEKKWESKEFTPQEWKSAFIERGLSAKLNKNGIFVSGFEGVDSNYIIKFVNNDEKGENSGMERESTRALTGYFYKDRKLLRMIVIMHVSTLDDDFEEMYALLISAINKQDIEGYVKILYDIFKNARGISCSILHDTSLNVKPYPDNSDDFFYVNLSLSKNKELVILVEFEDKKVYLETAPNGSEIDYLNEVAALVISELKKKVQ
jgi:hypothetical protein